MVLIAAMLIAVVVGAVLLVWDASATSFHYEREYPAGETKYVQLALDNLRDTNVTVTFTDDPTLMYSIDVTLYKPGMTYTIEEEELIYSWTIDLVGTGRVKSVDVVLGTGTSYSVFVRTGISINTTITYGNGAILDNREFLYSCNGTLQFNFGENVNFTKGGLRADIGAPAFVNRPSPLSLNIDLPEGMDGRIDFRNDPITFTQMAGWHHEGFGIYSTASWPFENPSLRMSVTFGSCLADLHD